MANPLVKKLFSKQLLAVVMVLVLVGAVGAAVYFFQQYQKAQQLLQNPTLAAQAQEDQLLSQVGKLMMLPTGEVPQVATVSDVTKLQDQPFFTNAKNGDKVLIYTKARTAILYDPLADKIITVAPVNLGNTLATVTPTSAPSLAPVVGEATAVPVMTVTPQVSSRAK